VFDGRDFIRNPSDSGFPLLMERNLYCGMLEEVEEMKICGKDLAHDLCKRNTSDRFIF
jgi:hypothetical protein